VVNFSLLAAEIVSLVWGTPANYNRFRVLPALLHGTPVVGVSQTLRRSTEGATYIRQGGHHVGHWPTFLVSSFFLAKSQLSHIGSLPCFYTCCGLSANLECRSDMCCTWLAEIQNAKIAKNSPSGHRHTTSSGYIFATKARINNRKKTWLLQWLLHTSSQYGELRPTNG